MTFAGNSVTFYVDDTLVQTRSSGAQVDWVRIRMSGQSWLPAWTGCCDDFSADYTLASGNVIPEPSTLAIWATLGGLSLIAVRRRKAA
jgi:hypothetical protein